MIFAAACSTNPQTGESQIQIFSEEAQIRLGRSVAPQLEKEFGGRYRDIELQMFVEEVGGRVAQVSRRPHMPYRFTVLDSRVLNAFALPDGSIYITRGLLMYIESEDQLAAVLGHEISHVSGEHATRRYSEAVVAQIGFAAGQALGAALTRGSDREQILAAASAAQYYFALIHLSYRREDEMQADHFGSDYAFEAGYDPTAMIEVLQILERESQEGPQSTVPPWVRTHPPSEERLLAARGHIDATFPPHVLAARERMPDRLPMRAERFRRMRPAIEMYDEAEDAYHEEDYTRALERVNAAIAHSADFLDAYLGRAWVKVRLGDANGALEDFSYVYQRDPANNEARFGIGRQLAEGARYDEALPHLNAVIDEDPADFRAQYYVGRCYLGQGRYDDAADKFSLVLELLEKRGSQVEPYYTRSQQHLRAIRARP